MTFTVPPHIPPPDDRSELGLMLLMLAAHGEVGGRTWRELEVMVTCRVEDAGWAAVGFISKILDDLSGANQ